MPKSKLKTREFDDNSFMDFKTMGTQLVLYIYSIIIYGENSSHSISKTVDKCVKLSMHIK